ncbi:uncharacterized protein LOC110008223 [Amborella trichopoda]|uniref:uncharacterized protein LOC110008223 n=1 Tax=Amborella trichopoda TaxID=13333 RepID=UPI0009BCB603|nr:uncharacterized protein LOC110008223 [Amborella trichopoda]XP_020529955.1 uncharacterized protein LOC110008223 [Amborella trichopoda]|eukprot:XP_020529954.1 uncharacterized protein LOC110008223 [Amborella trichopoda]
MTIADSQDSEWFSDTDASTHMIGDPALRFRGNYPPMCSPPMQNGQSVMSLTYMLLPLLIHQFYMNHLYGGAFHVSGTSGPSLPITNDSSPTSLIEGDVTTATLNQDVHDDATHNHGDKIVATQETNQSTFLPASEYPHHHMVTRSQDGTRRPRILPSMAATSDTLTIKAIPSEPKTIKSALGHPGGIVRWKKKLKPSILIQLGS